LKYIALCIFIVCTPLLCIGPPPKNQTGEAVSGHISLESIKRHVQVLGSDEFQGRRTGTPGGEKAARYISDQMESIGLRPMGDDGGFFQWIPMHGSIPQPDSELAIFVGDDVHRYQLNRDYLLYKSGDQTFIPNPIPLVFVGYGITAPEYDYDDYQSLNVEGKIVVFLSGEPASDDSGFFEGREPTVYAYPESKQRIAISHGAYGSILIHCVREEETRPWRELTREFAFEDISLAYSVSSNLNLIMNARAAAKLFSESPFDLSQVLEMEKRLTLRSFPLKTKLRFRGQSTDREFSAANLVGMIPKRDAKSDDSCILISAHYDHLGIGPPVSGDSIYNGVMDNAIGVAALLEIARALINAPAPKERSIIFLFTTGEEEGLLGSTYYTHHPVIPLYKTVAGINIDGMAMFDRFKNVIGIGAELSTLGEHLKQVAIELGYYVSPVPIEFSASRSYLRADQIAFAQAGIPSILIAEGLDGFNLRPPEMKQKMIHWMRTVYHSPFDDLEQAINYEAVIQHSRFIASFCQSLADSSYEIKWKPGTPYINIRLRSIAERR
jgi:hypothetical protein